MDPFGTSIVSPRSASVGPYRLQRSVVSITSGSGIAASCLPQTGQLGFEQAPDLLVAESPCAQPLHRRRHDALSRAQRLGELFPPVVLRHKGARAVTQLDDALVLQLAVGLGDGVRVDHEFLRERPDARQLLPGPEGPRLDGVLHLLHQLEVDWNAERRIGPEEHRIAVQSDCTTVIAQCDCVPRLDEKSGGKVSRGRDRAQNWRIRVSQPSNLAAAAVSHARYASGDSGAVRETSAMSLRAAFFAFCMPMRINDCASAVAPAEFTVMDSAAMSSRSFGIG